MPTGKALSLVELKSVSTVFFDLIIRRTQYYSHRLVAIVALRIDTRTAFADRHQHSLFRSREINMALKSSIYKAKLNVTDMDRHVYQEFPLTIACHPSETEARMMLRILAFAMHANERLEFGRGISTDNEPDLWQKSLSDDIELWIDLGAPDESLIRKASGRAKKVILYAYGDRSASVWWSKQERAFKRFSNLRVVQISDDSLNALAELASSNMSLQCVIEDGQVVFSSADHDEFVEVELTLLKE